MSTLTTGLQFVADLALGTWFGAMVFFSFVGAPTTFAVLGSDDAGSVVNAIFPRYYTLGIGLGLVALVGIVARGVLTQRIVPAGGAAGATVLAILTAGYARYRLIPKMEAAGDEAFDRYHDQSVRLNAVALLAVFAALIATHI